MNYKIPLLAMPKEVEISSQRSPEEMDKPLEPEETYTKKTALKGGGAFHEKSAKNSKVKNAKKSYHLKIEEKYKKPIRRGDKVQNMKKKNKKK